MSSNPINNKCEMCGKQGWKKTIVETHFCKECSDIYREVICDGCGQRMVFGSKTAITNICSSCKCRQIVERLSKEQKAEIAFQLESFGGIPAIKRTKEMLGYSLHISIDIVELIRSDNKN